VEQDKHKGCLDALIGGFQGPRLFVVQPARFALAFAAVHMGMRMQHAAELGEPAIPNSTSWCWEKDGTIRADVPGILRKGAIRQTQASAFAVEPVRRASCNRPSASASSRDSGGGCDLARLAASESSRQISRDRRLAASLYVATKSDIPPRHVPAIRGMCCGGGALKGQA
jgi:hypothetical protein